MVIFLDFGSQKRIQCILNKELTLNIFASFLAVSLVSLLAGSAFAHEGAWSAPELKNVGRSEPVPTRQLTTIQASSVEQAVWEAASYLDAFTRATGFEGCGLIERNADGVEIVLSTNFSQIGCLTSRVPREGFETDQETIHSHPLDEKIYANPVDAVWGQVRRGNRVTVEPHTFSRRDRRNGSGYLVALGQLLYQDGTQEKALGAIASQLAAE